MGLLVSGVRGRYDWRLAGHPLMAGLPRGQLRKWAKAADEVSIDAGETLLRENRIGYWFFMITEGEAIKTRGGDTVGRLRAGDHVGEHAILAFAPQLATVVAATPMRAWVIGRRHLISLVHDSPVVQHRFFPDLEPGGYLPRIRQIRAEATLHWHAIPKDKLVLAREDPPPGLRAVRSAWRARASAPTIAEVSAGFFSNRGSPPVRPLEPLRLTRPVKVAMAVAGLVAAITVTLTYHPPVAVVNAHRPIDISHDIDIRGVPVHPVQSRYLLLTVSLERRNLAGTLEAVLTHRHRVRAAAQTSADDRAAIRREARAEFGFSREAAAAVAAQAAGYEVNLHGDGARVIGPAHVPSPLRAGDVIEAVDRLPVQLASDVDRLVAAGPADTPAVFTVRRDGAVTDVRLPRFARRQRDLGVVLETEHPRFSLPFTISFRPRPIGGPSGGLVYALAISEMLGGRTMRGGLSVAASGALDVSGRILPIGYAADKASAAGRAHALRLLLPADQTDDVPRGWSGGTITGVSTFDDAVRVVTQLH